ncbi:PhoX family protein [Helicobacter sp.]|uniref:PhoX family protein n=1 Tax=Helicobacter sp. TaxID=218 RepID=UPI0025BDC4DD|nr:PhoX family phosphatase [Helicobacter sp.]MCI5969323.1 PhoX family phosphatase [Helicobacter sp.]MDY2585577.1 PhoX family phosphatase [Helicobacter sp.]
MQRRSFLKASSLALSYVGFFGLSPLNAKEQNLLGFKAIPISTEDSVIVPEGYEVKPLISFGDPLFSNATPFDESKTINQNSVLNAAKVFGDNTDGMSLFPIDENRAILAVNNEYINPELIFNDNGKNIDSQKVAYEQNAMGVSVFEIKRDGDGFKVVLDSPYNRRITAHTPMQISGPAKGHKSMQTQADKKGELALGTINNCANGQTPWGTYLTCEENFDSYFGSSNPNYNFNPSEKRYGLSTKSNYGWELDPRFDIAKNPNEPNRFGWVVEIDPYDANSTPIKRTALGRFKHENVEIVISKEGNVVAYMGDDEANEFLYKFVSKGKFDKNNPRNNRNLLEEGTLYVAKLQGNDLSGSGKWIELSYGKNGLDSKNGFHSQADILINARLAGSIVGATPMDRPEWIAADPKGEFIYATLTNNKKREESSVANPREKNVYGHIIRWNPSKNNHSNADFKWDIFLLAGNPAQYPNDLRKGTSNITKDNMFNSPDGLKFDKFGRLWIQTDGSYSNKGDYEGMGNNQMLCANPVTGEIKRFLTGPIASEVTGLAFSPDYKTMFVGIQHPGERLAPSHYPNGGNSTPRSTIVQITKKDGGIIGS